MPEAELETDLWDTGHTSPIWVGWGPWSGRVTDHKTSGLTGALQCTLQVILHVCSLQGTLGFVPRRQLTGTRVAYQW